MKQMFKFQLSVLLLYVLSSCSATHFKEGIPQATDPTYGYTAEHPLALKAGFKKEAAEKTAEYLSYLRTPNGEKLKMVSKVKIANPNYKKPGLVYYNWITGEKINQGNGRFLVAYKLVSESGQDSLQLYVNHFANDALQVPSSLFLTTDINAAQGLVSERMTAK